MDAIDPKLWADVMAEAPVGLGPPASGQAIATFEAAHGVSLPPSHRAFLLRASGGVVGRARLFGVGRSDSLDLGRQVAEVRPELESMAAGPVLPFASDWGGSYFCYDLGRPDGIGGYPVLFWDHEYSEEPEDRPMLWSGFAADFEGFLRKILSGGSPSG